MSHTWGHRGPNLGDIVNQTGEKHICEEDGEWGRSVI